MTINLLHLNRDILFLTVLIILLISPIMIIYSYIFYIQANGTNPYDHKIKKKSELVKIGLFLCILLGICYLIVYQRMLRMGLTVDLNEYKDSVIYIVKETSYQRLSIYVYVFILIGIFWITFLRLLKYYIYNIFLKLYLYLYQFEWFRKMCYKQIHVVSDFKMLVIRIFIKFTKNNKILNIVQNFWPIGLLLIEKNTFRYLFVYVIMADIILLDWQIYKIFYILPYLFIYMLLRKLWLFFYDGYTRKNFDTCQNYYTFMK